MSYPYSTSCGEVGKILHIILNNVFTFKNNGVFIEIGANDGKTGSFTYNLAEIGWYGINFEPVPRIYDLCCKNHKHHKNVKNFNIAIGASRSEVNILDAGTLSTIDKDTIQVYSNIPQFAGHINNNTKYHTIKLETLNYILEENNVSNIDLLVLDVEGYEENVLKGFSIEKYSPSIFIIEIGDQHPDFVNNKIMMNKYTILREYFKKNNYTLLVNDIVDNVYIHNSIYNELNTDFIREIKKLVKFPQYN